MANCKEEEDGAHQACRSLDPVKAFIVGMTNEVNAAEVCRMMDLQQHMMCRFEKTNEMLLNFNRLSDSRFETTQTDFRKHIQLLQQTKNDLDIIFRRIRVLRDKLGTRYPAAFNVCAQVHSVPDDDELPVSVQQPSTTDPSCVTETLPLPTRPIEQCNDDSVPSIQ
jgi:hypothetical protein